MEVDKFFEEMMIDEYPKAKRLRYWWERFKFNIWLKLPVSNNSKKTNRDFVESIPSYD